VRRPARRACAAFLVACLLSAVTAHADSPQFWFPTNLVVQFAPEWAVAVQVEPRWDDGRDADLDRVLFRPALVWQPVSALTLWAGYGYTEVIPEGSRDDQLLWQQAVYTFRSGDLSVAPRVRMEERFIERTDGTAWRLRTHLRVVHPVPRATGWSFVAWHESFMPLNTVDGAQTAGYAQGRYFAGVQKRVSKHVTLEPGYLALYNHQSSDDEWEHVVNVGVQVRF
jgi:hypothetical protein